MRSVIALAALVLAASRLSAGEPARPKPTQHEFKDVERWAREFEAPDREEWQKPGTVVRVLTVELGLTVADIGAGTGYFTKVLSVGVGETGKVYAVDIEPRMLAYIRERKDLLPNVVTVQAAPDDPKLPAGAIDLVTVVNTWHHIRERGAYLAQLRPALSREGRVAIIDWRKGDIPVGPPAAERVGREDVIAEFENAGWRLVTESVALPYQYFLVFYPPAP
jgi:arsenite methyltransferase